MMARTQFTDTEIKDILIQLLRVDDYEVNIVPQMDAFVQYVEGAELGEFERDDLEKVRRILKRDLPLD